jgi:thiol-disulfide isomerase/thioredoxin
MKELFTILFLSISIITINAQEIKDFTMTSTDGVTYNLFDELNDGKTIVLDFFSTTCGSCQTSIPPLENAWNEYFQNGAYGYVWSIEAAYRPDSAINAFMDQYGGTFPAFSIINDDSVVNDTFGYYVPYTPYFYIICPNFKIHNFSIDELDRFIANCGVQVGLEDQIWKYTKVYAYNNHIKYIDLPSSYISHRVEMYDITGKKILEKNVFDTSGEIRIAENLNGIFLVKISNQTNEFSTKILIE